MMDGAKYVLEHCLLRSFGWADPVFRSFCSGELYKTLVGALPSGIVWMGSFNFFCLILEQQIDTILFVFTG